MIYNSSQFSFQGSGEVISITSPYSYKQYSDLSYIDNYIKLYYCKEMVSQDDTNEKKDNIFSYLQPERIFVTRSEPHPEVAIMCKYRYDLEHGLAVVFSNNGDTRVVIQDEIL